jgi:hypothetical protein
VIERNEFMNYKPLPVGVDNFDDIITNGYYYVDKTLMIKELLYLKGKVNLFTRPRRFGKTLNMSMLQHFFEDRGNQELNNYNKKLFDGLKIMQAGDKYTSHMCKYPVINISLKSAKKDTFDMAYESIKEIIIETYSRHKYLLDSAKLNEGQKKLFKSIYIKRMATDSQFYNSLKFLSMCLYEHFGKKVVVLIDEYDVPLETAYYNGFYNKMINLIRSLFDALKTNDYLQFAVVTGCLRISKEAIFTGLNNLEMLSILSEAYSEHYGFTEKEIDEMLKFYSFEDNKGIIKDWYNGYVFGNTEVYNPWSIINYVKSIYVSRTAFPKPYWSNTSSNNIVKKLIETSTLSIKESIESLINGNTMEIQVHEEITYGDIETSEENIWNFLFFTGYLRKVSARMEGKNIYVSVNIPNKEVEYIYENTIINWFDKIIKAKDMTVLYKAVLEGDDDTFSDIVTDELMNTISYYDYKEEFYHGMLIGIFSKMGNYTVVSNLESGLGRPDILIKPRSVRKEAIILELKRVKNVDNLEKACYEALEQIEKNKYEESLKKDGFRKFIKYGVAFFKKDCMVKCKK